jgi:outer membrane immunogenic protein
MYRKLLGGTAIALALAASPALAADMGYPVKAPPMMAVVPVFTWTGFYIGANVGYGWGDASGYSPYDNSNYATIVGLVTSGSGDPDGWFGGLQAGYNYQFYNNVVLGLEADVQFADMKSTYNYGYTVTNLGDTQQDDADFGVYGKYTTKIDTFGTVRARLGYAMDRFLPYVTGGLAWANVKVSGNSFVDGDNLSGWSGSHSDTYWGWALGGGVEYAFTDNWTMKAEYIYADLGSTSFDGLFNEHDLDFSMQTLKVGVNYKF